VPEVLCRGDGERWALLLMEGTEADEVFALFGKGDPVVADKASEVRGAFDLIDLVLAYGHGAVSGMKKISIEVLLKYCLQAITKNAHRQLFKYDTGNLKSRNMWLTTNIFLLFLPGYGVFNVLNLPFMQ
jgi:hypothetical protein